MPGTPFTQLVTQAVSVRLLPRGTEARPRAPSRSTALHTPRQPRRGRWVQSIFQCPVAQAFSLLGGLGLRKVASATGEVWLRR